MPPYSVVFSVTAPDMQIVVVPAMSTSATTAMAKVSFTVLPREIALRNGQIAARSTGDCLRVNALGSTCFLSLGQRRSALNFIFAAVQ
jgi:hypothetical protein